MAMSSSMRRRSGLTTTEACSWDIEGTSRDEGDPSCSEPHPTPSSSHRLHQLYSTPPQALPRSGFVHGPPVEVCAGFELIVIENATALGHDVLELSKRREVLVGEWLIQNRPEVFGGLEVGGVRGQEDGPDPVRGSQVGGRVPTGIVELQYNDPLASRPGLARKQSQQRGKERLRHPVRDVPEGLARGW